MEVVIVVYSMDEIGIPKDLQPEEFPFVMRTHVWDSVQLALDDYAETPCFWSEYFQNQEENNISALLTEVKDRILSGEIDQYL